MVEDDINIRIKRIYSALNVLEESDLETFMPTIVRNGRTITVTQSFEGNFTEKELSNLAHSMIYSIANLYAHLKKWALNNNLDTSKVDDVFNSSNEIKIIQDLSNNDRHPYPPRDGGRSGKFSKN